MNAKVPAQAALSLEDTLDHLALSVDGQLALVGAKSVSVPEMFSLRCDYQHTPLAIEPFARVGETMAMGRAARVRGGQKVQVLNLVWIPTLDAGLPILGCELLAFQKGFHLFVLDAFPLYHHDGNIPHAAPGVVLREWRERFSQSLSLAPIPAWGEAVFSEDAIILKPGQQVSDASHLLQEMGDALQALAQAVCEASQEAFEPTPAQRQEAKVRRDRYLYDHAHDEPAGPFLQRLGGEAWASSFIHRFLFPQWLRQEDCAPPWLDAQEEAGT